MFFKKHKLIDLGLISAELNIEDKIILKRLKILEFKLNDLKYLKNIQPVVKENIDKIVDKFYNVIESEKSLTDIIKEHSTINRLKITLRSHILEMFNGVIDDEYISKREKIAKVHVHIGLPSQWYVSSFEAINKELYNIVQDNIKNEQDKINTILSISKIINLEQQLVLSSFDEYLNEQQKAIEEEKQKINKAVVESSENLASITQETLASYHQLQIQIKNVLSFATKAKQLADTMEIRADEAGTVAEIISVSDTNTLVKKSLLKLSSSLGRRPNLSLIKENNDEAYFLVTGVATSSNNGISGMVIKVNKSSLAISIEVSEFLIDNSVNSGNSMNTHLLDEDGKYKVVIFHNEGSNLSMNITIFELDYRNLSYLSNTKKKQNILPIANSGTLTATSLGTTVHSEIYMGKGIFLMVYRNGNSLEHSQININDTIITVMKTSIIGTGEVWRFPMIMDFENRNYAVFHSNSSTTNGVSLIVPETNVRKAYPESTCVGGVTNSSGSFPSELEIIVPK